MRRFFFLGIAAPTALPRNDGGTGGRHATLAITIDLRFAIARGNGLFALGFYFIVYPKWREEQRD